MDWTASIRPMTGRVVAAAPQLVVDCMAVYAALKYNYGSFPAPRVCRTGQTGLTTFLLLNSVNARLLIPHILVLSAALCAACMMRCVGGYITQLFHSQILQASFLLSKIIGQHPAGIPQESLKESVPALKARCGHSIFTSETSCVPLLPYGLV